MLSQDLLLLTQCPDYYMMSTGLCKLLLSGTRSSPAFNAMCLQLSPLHKGDVLPHCTPAKWEMAGAREDVLDFDPLSGHAVPQEKPPTGKRGRCAWTREALTTPK